MFLGIDACKSGWVIARVNGQGNFTSVIRENNFHNICSLLKNQEVTLALIDIPIGLNSNGPKERTCDLEARKYLGNKRGSSVFRVPIRQAVYSEIREVGNQLNHQYTGKKISLQSWGIVPKIKEVDSYFLLNPDLQTYLRESHPEVCFMGLNSGNSLEYRKKASRGITERLKILKRFDYNAESIYSDALFDFPRKQVAKDDILDAMVLAYTAFKVVNDRPYSFPEKNETEIDENGLKQEIVFWLLTELHLD